MQGCSGRVLLERPLLCAGPGLHPTCCQSRGMFVVVLLCLNKPLAGSIERRDKTETDDHSSLQGVPDRPSSTASEHHNCRYAMRMRLWAALCNGWHYIFFKFKPDE